MAYDKKSFLAGITVGTQLKGWSGVGSLTSGTVIRIGAAITVPKPFIPIVVDSVEIVPEQVVQIGAAITVPKPFIPIVVDSIEEMEV